MKHILLCSLICLSNRYTQITGPKGLKFSGFDGGHLGPGDVITKMGGGG